MDQLTEINLLRAENLKLKEALSSLKEQLEWFHRQIFGKRSEKSFSNNGQILLEGFDSPTTESSSKTIQEHQRSLSKVKGSDTLTFPDDLPVEKIYLDLPEEKKLCPNTGQALVKIGEDVTQKLAHRPGSYYIKQIIRPKYAHPKLPENGIQTPNLPPSLLDRCMADDTFLADLLVQKYADHLPLYRISEKLSREGIQISRQILSKWVLRSAMALKPLYQEMQKEILESDNLFIDETPVKMLDPGAGETKFTYMWVVSGGKEANPAHRVYYFRDSRQHVNAEELLKGFRGVVHSDKYGAYEKLAQKKEFTWCPCWAHIRRKFFEAEHGDKDFREVVLREINALFEMEKNAWTKSPDERLRIRQEEAIPIIDKLTEKIKNRLSQGNVLPKSNFKEALGYYISLIPYLKNYTFHPWSHLDNNVSERAIRPIAIGRKNWLFLGNTEGGEAAGIILSFVQSCRALEINPRLYLESIMGNLLDYPRGKIRDLLPKNWAKKHALT